MSGNKVGFGIIGLGMIAQFHARAINESEHGRVVAVASRDIEKAEKFVSKIKEFVKI